MELIFTFRTVNQAIQAERELLGAGFGVKVMPLPAAVRAGCGLALRLPGEQAADGSRLLAQRGVEAQGIYARDVVDGKSVYAPYGGDYRETNKRNRHSY